MELETINKLYLELSQIATATTAKERKMTVELAEIDSLLWPEGKPIGYNPDRAIRLRALLRLCGKKP